MNLKKYPDRIFFWGILNSIIPDWADEYYNRVMKTRMEEETISLNHEKLIQVSESWLEKLN